MSTAARKARKREGIKFERTPKVGTPLEERAIPWFRRRVDGKWQVLPGANASRRISERIAFRDQEVEK